MKNYLLIFLVLSLALGACKKQTSSSTIPNGDYSGVLEVYSNTYKMPTTYPVAISFENKKYKVTTEPGKQRGGGSGTYSIKGEIGNFQDENIWTADFDWNLILSGIYEVQLKDESLILIKQLNTNSETALSYKYILKRK
ncbi:MAG: hypothetical protein EOO90_30710 [Pedobacter sp.]|nr:MAG: hypothetical protein EOO90_30710 [Pedobacter sp.]